MSDEAKCGFLWLPSSDLRCTLPANHTGMHWAKYKIGDEEGVAGECWWNGEFLEMALAENWTAGK